ncbi:hypothetical protein NDA11_004336 [Ustilago hordei]|nr:hypothetical protein NDA11_004336 [Ustilago hordei]
MATYKRVWIVGRPSPTGGYKYMQLIKGGGEDILVRHEDEDDIRKHFLDAQHFERKYGSKALGLRYGLPFAKRKGSLFSSYKVPEWEKVKASTKEFNLATTELSELRNRLHQKSYLKVHDSVNGELLGFKLDKNGGVLFEKLGRYLGRA